MKPWKLLGLAGLAGVAATGVVIVRGERRRQAFTPDEVRARLHQRYATAEPGAATSAEAAVTTARPAAQVGSSVSMRLLAFVL